MAGIFGPPWRVDGPPPSAPLYTLLGAARVLDDLDAEQIERWINGVLVYPYPTDTAYVWDPCAAASDATEKLEGGTIPLPQFGAMVVYVAERCSSMGIFGKGLSNDEAQARFVARATAVLGAVEAAAVEREFLAGDVLGTNPYLADGNGTFPWGDTATTIVNGLAVLENEIAKSGRAGMIHLSPGLTTAAANERLIARDDRTGTLRTINGTTVVPGYGYAADPGDGVAPAGHTDPGDTQEWAYATGPVDVRRSDVLVVPENLSEALDRENNLIEYRVERYYVVDWDTAVQAAVRIDRCTDDCGTPS